jgi:hypothetical protein
MSFSFAKTKQDVCFFSSSNYQFFLKVVNMWLYYVVILL